MKTHWFPLRLPSLVDCLVVQAAKLGGRAAALGGRVLRMGNSANSDSESEDGISQIIQPGQIIATSHDRKTPQTVVNCKGNGTPYFREI